MNFHLCSKSEGINIIQINDILLNLQIIFILHHQHFLSPHGANAKDNTSPPPAESLQYNEYKRKPQKSEWNHVFILGLHILAKTNNLLQYSVITRAEMCYVL